MPEFTVKMRDGTVKTVQASTWNTVLGSRRNRQKAYHRFWRTRADGQHVVVEDILTVDVEMISGPGLAVLHGTGSGK